jgi:hypothetical protein
MINQDKLKSNYTLFGGKGNVWNNTAHIYKSGTGNLCGTPALSTNHVRLEGVTVAGCEECCRIYTQQCTHENTHVAVKHVSGLKLVKCSDCNQVI